MTGRDIARLRLANQQITAHTGTTPLQVVTALGAIQAFQRGVPGGNGVFHPTIMVQGKAVGIWRLGTEKEPSSVVDLFSPLHGGLSERVDLGVARVR